MLFNYNKYMGLIYKITNLMNQKIYVGQTTKTIEERWTSHKEYARKGTTYLSRAIQKYGQDNFQMETLEVCEDHLLNEREQHWVAHLKSNDKTIGYNMSCGGDNGNNTKSPEVRKKISDALKGKTRLPLTEERKYKISLANTGKRRTPEQCEKIKNSRTYGPLSEETKAKIKANANEFKRFKHSLETRQQIFEACQTEKSDLKIARLSGTSRKTVWRIRRQGANYEKKQ